MRAITVLYEDDHLLAVSKPPGLLTVPPPRSQDKGERTLVGQLRSEGRSVFAVHRLDRETSGVCLFAKSAEAREEMMRAFQAKTVRKWYRAIVQGVPSQREGRIDAPIQDLGKGARISREGQPATTLYRVLSVTGPCAVLELELLTGRHNQARLHLAHIGHPLVGERKYAFGRDAVLRHKRAALHARRIEFISPWSGGTVVVEAVDPPDFATLLARAGKSREKPDGSGLSRFP